MYIRIQLVTCLLMCAVFCLIRKGSSQLCVAESIKTWPNQNSVSSQWSVLLLCTHWHCLRPPHRKGTFTNHHHPGLPALCSQDHLSCADTDCDIAHELKRQPMRGLHSCPGRCLISPIYPMNSPCFPFCLSTSHIHPSAAAKSYSVLSMVVNGLFNLLLGCNCPFSISIVLRNMAAFMVQTVCIMPRFWFDSFSM